MARVFTGLFGGVISALIYGKAGDYIPYERRGRAMGKVMAAFAVASVMGVPIGIWLAAEFSWHRSEEHKYELQSLMRISEEGGGVYKKTYTNLTQDHQS